MPTVPTYNRQVSPGQSRVREGGINPPRMVNAPVEAFGSADAKTGEMIGQAINDVGMAGMKIATDEIRKENQLAEDARFLGLSAGITEKANALQIQATSQKGRNAFAQGEIIDKDWGKFQDEILKQAEHSETLKARVLRELWTQRAGLKKQYEIHVAREAEELQTNELNASIKATQDRAGLVAFDTPEIDSLLAKQESAIYTQAQLKGIDTSSDQFKVGLRESLSSTHRTVIESRINASDPGSAKEYLDLNRENMTTEDREAIKSRLKDSLVRTKADKLSQEAVAKHGDLNAALKAFDSMDLDIDEKKEAIAMTRMRFEIREDAKKKNQESNFEVLSKAVERAVQLKNAGDPRAISEMKKLQDSNQWSNLDSKYRNSLTDQFNDADRINDDDVWLEFSSLGKGQIAAMSNADYKMNVWGKLSKDFRSKADTLRRQAMEGASEENQTISKWSSYGKDVEQYLSANKIYKPSLVPTKGLEGKRLAFVTEANKAKMAEWNAKMIRVQEKVEEFEVRKKNKATPEEIRSVVAEQWLITGPQPPSSGAAAQPISNEPSVGFDQIPNNEKARGRAEFFKATGREPSDNELTDFYNAAKTRDTKRIEQILGIRSPGGITAKPQQAKRKPLAPIDYRKGISESKRVKE